MILDYDYTFTTPYSGSQCLESGKQQVVILRLLMLLIISYWYEFRFLYIYWSSIMIKSCELEFRGVMLILGPLV